MTLELDAHLRLGTLNLNVELGLDAGETVAILGPNGSGKTTLLRVLAGLQPLERGTLRLDGQLLDDVDSRVFVPPEQRSIGVVFQDYLLFPNLTARENVAFGLRARGANRRTARETADRWLDRVALTDAASLRARQLSGGQQQRVALARALATGPRLLLLDEPLAALDAGTRNDVRRELRRHLANHDGLRIIVTHDPIDAHALADRVIVVEAGEVTHRGTLSSITAHPRSPYVGHLVGVNLLEGTLCGTALHLPGDAQLVVAPEDTPDGPAFAALPPASIALHRVAPSGSPRNSWATNITEIDHIGDRVRVRLDEPIAVTAEITAAALAELDLQSGQDVWASVKATEITVYPA